MAGWDEMRDVSSRALMIRILPCPGAQRGPPRVGGGRWAAGGVPNSPFVGGAADAARVWVGKRPESSDRRFAGSMEGDFGSPRVPKSPLMGRTSMAGGFGTPSAPPDPGSPGCPARLAGPYRSRGARLGTRRRAGSGPTPRYAPRAVDVLPVRIDPEALAPGPRRCTRPALALLVRQPGRLATEGARRYAVARPRAGGRR